MQNLLAGHLASYYSTRATEAPQIAAGKVISLATTGPQRTALMSDVPTVAESGFPRFNATNWSALSRPRKPVALQDR